MKKKLTNAFKDNPGLRLLAFLLVCAVLVSLPGCGSGAGPGRRVHPRAGGGRR